MDKIPRKKGAKYWLAAAFAIGFFAVGLPYWQIPYAKVFPAHHRSNVFSTNNAKSTSSGGKG
jgi:hypothetical protein